MAIEEIGKPGFRYRTDFKRPGQRLLDEITALMDQTGCLTGNVRAVIAREEKRLDQLYKKKGLPNKGIEMEWENMDKGGAKGVFPNTLTRNFF